MWENYAVPKKYRLGVAGVVIFVLIAHFAMCMFVTWLTKTYLAGIRFDYFYGYACDEFENMLGSDMSNWLQWAQIDQKHVKFGQQTGIY
jgi:hypothetical protein